MKKTTVKYVVLYHVQSLLVIQIEDR